MGAPWPRAPPPRVNRVVNGDGTLVLAYFPGVPAFAGQDYEQKLKKKEEDDEKKRKQLEAELKNIKKETQEIAQGFDAALQVRCGGAR